MNGVPAAVRDSPPDLALKLVWTAVNLLALPLVFYACFSGGDAFYEYFHDGANSGRSSQAAHQVRATAFALSVLRVTGHILWGVFLCPHALPLSHMAPIAGFSAAVDCAIGLACVWHRTEYSLVYDNLVVCTYLVGQFIERGAEFDRTVFKSRPENKGKMHIVGLYKYVVHINYLGFLIRQFAFLSLPGVWFVPVALTAGSVYQFKSGDIKNQRERNIRKYGDEFKLYWDTTPKLIPGVY